MSGPSLAEQKKNRLLEIAVGVIILAIWGLVVFRGTIPDGGAGLWIARTVGPVTILQICYASWKYYQLARQSPKG